MNCPILLVEDAETDVFLIKRVFKTLELNKLQVVSDGRKALDYLAGNGPYADREEYPLPCLVLLDLRLPYLPGLEVLQWIRQQQRFKKMPVIVLTSSKEERDVERAYALGANSYLVKPLELDTLTEMMRSMRDYWLRFNHPPATT